MLYYLWSPAQNRRPRGLSDQVYCCRNTWTPAQAKQKLSPFLHKARNPQLPLDEKHSNMTSGDQEPGIPEGHIFPPATTDDNEKLLNDQNSTDVWNLLLIFRFINALCVRTFFQPDEYFQSLEPAWQIAFGSQSGAWITWVSFPEFINQASSSF